MLARASICACALLAELGVAHARAPRAVLHDTDIVVDTTLIRETEATAYVAVSGARTLTSSAPLGGASVRLSLVSKEAKKSAAETVLGTATTGDDGVAVVRFRVPKLPAGDYRLVAHTRSRYGEDRIVRPVRVTDGTHLHLRTDRGVYKPGQPLRWRVTAVSAADAHPLEREVELTIKDPRGTAIWRGAEKSDATGMIAGEVPLGDDITLGNYSLTATAGSARVSETVEVRAFRLPAFTVAIEPASDRPAVRGSTLHAKVVARYAYGEPVRGRAHVRASTGYGTVFDRNLDLDEHGQASIALTVPVDGSAIDISADVIDGSARRQTGSTSVPVESDSLGIAIVPERKRFVAGQKQWVTVITTDGRGALAPAKVWLRVPGRAGRLVKQSQGAVRFSFVPKSGTTRLRASASDGRGRVANTDLNVATESGRARWIRVREAVVAEGGSIAVEGVWKKGAGPVVVTLLKHGAPLASRVATVDDRGKLFAMMHAPTGTFGLATVRVTGLGWDKKTGAVRPTYDQASLYLTPATLDVRIDSATRHKPGENAEVRVSVADSYGRPAPGVGLAASVVDERVLALSKSRPNLVEVLRSLDVENARAAGVLFVGLLRGERGRAQRAAMRAIVEALPPSTQTPEIQLDAANRFRAELARMGRAEAAVHEVLLHDARRLGRRDRKGRWEFRDRLDSLLVRSAWTANERYTPWNRTTNWAYARALLPDWTFDAVSRRIVNERLDALYERLGKIRKRSYRVLHRRTTDGLSELVSSDQVAAYLALDPWGTAIRVTRERQEQKGQVAHVIGLVSAGPDLRFDTADDIERSDVFSEGVLGGYGTHGYGMGGGGVGYGSIGSGRYGTIGHGGGVGMGPVEMAVRRRFDETVLWVAGVRTDARGRASFEVPLADSITGWEVAVEAVGQRGSVGVAKARLETFLPMYVDAEVPNELTVGDRYVLSAVVANHTKKRRSLSVTASIGGGLELAGAPVSRIDLPAGTTGAVRVPVRGREPGSGTVRLALLDDQQRPVDVVERTVEVEPPGALVRELRTGTVRDGSGAFSIEIPKSAVLATTRGRVRLFRGAADQAIDGLEGMLREPYGCFEQTTSSTYPNLLVLTLLRDAPGMEQVIARARKLVSKGYQRLISYEVTGGGFSWFGDAPANQVLTAFGLMEFVDMARVYPVDPELIARTRKWLIGKQRPDGSWKPDASWLHDWSAVQGKVSTTAYIAWALAESGYRGKALDRALQFLRGHRGALADNPYHVAMWAGAESLAKGGSRGALALLRKHTHRDGAALRIGSGGKTLFYATGKGADVQVTALGATALRRAGAAEDASAALSWVWSARSPNYGWGTTQGTVLALRAAAEAADKSAPREGTLAVRLDGKQVGTIDLASPNVPGFELPPDLSPGRHQLAIDGEVAGSLSADLRVAWRDSAAPTPTRHGIEVALASKSRAKTRVGEQVELELSLKNPGKEDVAMPTVVVPVPPGFRAVRDSLERLVSRHVIAKYEDQGSEIQLYLTELHPGAEVELAYALEATAECDVAQRPARAYAFYDPEIRGSTASLRLEAKPRRKLR